MRTSAPIRRLVGSKAAVSFAMSDTDKFSGWPGGRRFADDAHLHALGQMALAYNRLEWSFGILFSIHFPAAPAYSEDLFHSINNRRRIDLLRAVVTHNEKDEQVKELVLHALACFDICTDNRNILMHAMASTSSNTEILALEKRASNNSSRLINFEVPLTDLRRVADDCSAIVWFIVGLSRFAMDRDMRSWGKATRPEPLPLPDKPPRPHKLTPSQPPKADADETPPPQSSEA